MSETYIHQCMTCTLQRVIDGEQNAEVAFADLADGDAASDHKLENPTHVIVVHTSHWG